MSRSEFIKRLEVIRGDFERRNNTSFNEGESDAFISGVYSVLRLAPEEIEELRKMFWKDRP